MDGQTSQLASLQDEPCRSVPRRRTRSQGTQRRTSPPRPRCRSCCSRYTGWTHRSRSSRRCKMSTAGQCPRRRTRSQGTQRRASPPRPRCGYCCSPCMCWTGRRRSSRRCRIITAGQCPRRRTRSRGTQIRTSLPRPRCGCCCSRCACWTGRRRSSCRCKMSTAGQCPRRRTRSQGTQRRSSRHVQDAGAAAVGAGGGRADVAARVAAGRALEVSVHDAVLGRRARETYVPAASKM